MTAFFTCIMLLGIVLVLFSFIWLLSEKKRLHDYRDDLKTRKEDLIEVIEDAEELVQEMNRFSDYVVTQFEQKNQELKEMFTTLQKNPSVITPVANENGQNPKQKEILSVLDNIESQEEQPQILATETEEILPQYKGKVIPLNMKRREVLRLSNKGMNESEIAKHLNIGRGEIDLIARMGR